MSRETSIYSCKTPTIRVLQLMKTTWSWKTSPPPLPPLCALGLTLLLRRDQLFISIFSQADRRTEKESDKRDDQAVRQTNRHQTERQTKTQTISSMIYQDIPRSQRRKSFDETL